MNKSKKPTKKTDKELWILIEEKIQTVQCLFVDHAKARQTERGIDDLTVIHILENNGNARRKRNKKKINLSQIMMTGITVSRVMIMTATKLGSLFLLTAMRCSLLL